MMRGFTSVSYTHLDVYKRQQQYILGPFLRHPYSFQGFDGREYGVIHPNDYQGAAHEAVSYTHLDVYKRQKQNRITIRRFFTL